MAMRPFIPDLYYTDVHAVDLDDLKSRGVRALLVDLDNTLLPRDSNAMTAELRAWARRLDAEGFRVCLVSNNWHGRVSAVAAELGFEIVPKALKPLPFAFRRAMTLLDASPAETAVVGDQLFTDILGGNALGLLTVLVQPLSSTDLPHTLALRLIEQRLLADRKPTGAPSLPPHAEPSEEGPGVEP
ncbi:MAG: YqeG family HAD IIIA-type phosphatase [Coriobacteriia bacterium]|nr:YqeG family HAD IIIA-type phosphatase [Coriobacteriia bacterium]